MSSTCGPGLTVLGQSLRTATGLGSTLEFRPANQEYWLDFNLLMLTNILIIGAK